ncbi:MAG: hypothetical protein JO002_05670 [Burkholderiaceae bacterium]|nr:hypothetical protein [Burkholderiaceae bacterium]
MTNAKDMPVPNAVPLATTPKSRQPKRKKKRALFEPQASFARFPLWLPAFWEPLEEGRRCAGPHWVRACPTLQANEIQSSKTKTPARCGRFCLVPGKNYFK